MKRVYLSVCSPLSVGASLLLGWLGFASCDSIGMAGYGTPTVDYESRVRVTDQDTKPVEGFQVNLPNSRRDKKELVDAQDNVELESNYTGFHEDYGVALEVRGIDGEKNGVIVDKQMIMDTKESDLVSRGSRN